MSALVTNPAPDFTAPAVLPDNSIGEFKLADQKGRYTLLLFYPLDFSPVCPAEIMAFNARVAEFTERGCDIIGISIDSQFTHQAWRNASTDQGGVGQLDFTLVADLTKSIARSYDVLLNDAVALRSQFLIDPDGNVRHALINDLPFTRSVDEALRVIDAVRGVAEPETCATD
jgi:peroxiredoxin (alkyl hydroperoxide reductase subunit C)